MVRWVGKGWGGVGVGWDGFGWGWDGMGVGCDGMRWDGGGMAWHGMGWDGMGLRLVSYGAVKKTTPIHSSAVQCNSIKPHAHTTHLFTPTYSHTYAHTYPHLMEQKSHWSRNHPYPTPAHPNPAMLTPPNTLTHHADPANRMRSHAHHSQPTSSSCTSTRKTLCEGHGAARR